jgi:serine phosphatase RsbU (regulator of sigma subunit)
VAFVAIAVVGPLVGVRLLDAASGAQVGLANTRSDLDALLRTQLAEETALRGYVATRDRFFLDPDGPPNPRFTEQAHALQARLRSEHLTSEAQIVDNMRAVHDTWERDVALPLLREPARRDADMRQAYGKLLTDEMRLDAERLRTNVTRAGNRVQATLRREIDLTLAICVGIVGAFALLALWHAVGRAEAVARLDEERTLVEALQRTLRVAGEGLPRVRLGSAYASATREALVGGDLLDAWRSDPERGWLLIADASGKGIPAAQHAAFAQYALRAFAAESDDPGTILARFNRLFVSTFEDPESFLVAFLGAWDARTQTLSYASAGHGTAYARRDGLVEQLPPTGSLIGIERDQMYETNSVPLAPGDVVLLATDGLTEARDAKGDLLGEERVAAILARGPADPQALCDRLVDAANEHSGGVQDDLAIVALQVVAADETLPGPESAVALGEPHAV